MRKSFQNICASEIVCGSELVRLILVFLRYIPGLEIMSLAGKCVAKLVFIGKTSTV